MTRLMNGVPLSSSTSLGGCRTTMSPRLNESNRGVSLSTSTYWSGSKVRSIDVCWTWKGCATKVWMTKNVRRVRARVSTTSSSQRGGRVTTGVCRWLTVRVRNAARAAGGRGAATRRNRRTRSRRGAPCVERHGERSAIEVTRDDPAMQYVATFPSLDDAESALDWIGLDAAETDDAFVGRLVDDDRELLEATVADDDAPEPVRALARTLLAQWSAAESPSVA